MPPFPLHNVFTRVCMFCFVFFFYKRCFHLAKAEMLLCICQSSGGDHDRAEAFTCKQGWDVLVVLTVSWGWKKKNPKTKQWNASEVCLSLSVGVKRSLVIKAKLPLLPDGKERQSEEAAKESGRDKEERREWEAGVVDEKGNKWRF